MMCSSSVISSREAFSGSLCKASSTASLSVTGQNYAFGEPAQDAKATNNRGEWRRANTATNVGWID
jgi:hypothetical protein